MKRLAATFAIALVLVACSDGKTITGVDSDLTPQVATNPEPGKVVYYTLDAFGEVWTARVTRSFVDLAPRGYDAVEIRLLTEIRPSWQTTASTRVYFELNGTQWFSFSQRGSSNWTQQTATSGQPSSFVLGGNNDLTVHAGRLVEVGEVELRIYYRLRVPQSKDDCKDGGWDYYAFENQGQCVRLVETGKDSRG